MYDTREIQLRGAPENPAESPVESPNGSSSFKWQLELEQRRLTCATPISYTISHKNAKFMQLLQMPFTPHAPPHGVQRSETRDH